MVKENGWKSGKKGNKKEGEKEVVRKDVDGRVYVAFTTDKGRKGRGRVS